MEGTSLKGNRLINIILLVTLAYSSAIFEGTELRNGPKGRLSSCSIDLIILKCHLESISVWGGTHNSYLKRFIG